MSAELNKDILRKFIEEVWNKGNLEWVDQLVAEQYTIKNDPGDPCEFKTINLEIFKSRLQQSRTIFPDLHFDIVEMNAEDDKVVISWFMTGTQRGDLPNLPATGKKIKVSGITIYYFKEGKIIGHWQVFDRLSLLAQLGVQIGKNA